MQSTQVLKINFLASSMVTGETDDNECIINELEGFRFEDGLLKERFTNLQPDKSGSLNLQPEQMHGTLYFIANAASVIQNTRFIIGETSIEDFLNITANIESMTTNGVTMTGSVTLNQSFNTTTVTLIRSISRIDLFSPFEDVKILSVKIDGISTDGYVNIQEKQRTPENISATTYEENYQNAPLENCRRPLFYLCEQGMDKHKVEILVTTTEGAWHRLSTILPAIKRNTIYTLKVYGNGAEFLVETITNDWTNGAASESDLVLKGLIDKETSQLSKGVEVNEQEDTVYIPYWKSDFCLTVKAEENTHLIINGYANGVKLTAQDMTRSLLGIAKINVSSMFKMPGSIQEYIYLDTYLDNIQTGRIVLIFEPNPIQLTGQIQFDANGTCNFNQYIDGELGTISIPINKKLDLNISPQESPWIKLEKTDKERTYRIIAGWKPNDPTADGRIQEATLIISDNDNGNQEMYSIKRPNWGLPVVNINGTWWCKYNLRGNVKSFSDQILIKDEPTAENDQLFAYLQNCNDEELLQFLGDQYQAGNPEGLKLTYKNGIFYYEGYKTVSQNFGTMSPTEMAPAGYQIPDYDEFRFFTWNDNSNLGYNHGVFNNNLGQRLNYTIAERNLYVAGVEYGPTELYDFNYEDTHWTMLGLGHQWDIQSISKTMILLATYGNAKNTWLLEGYPQNDGRGNWFKYANHNASKTRTIRCIKTPVEYIYE